MPPILRVARRSRFSIPRSRFSSTVSVSNEDRLALKLRLQDTWREDLAKIGQGIVPVYEALVTGGQLRRNEAQKFAASSLALLPHGLATARLARQRWETEQEQLTSHAIHEAARTSGAREEAASWRNDGWFKGSPSTPSVPAVVGPVCWLSVGPPPRMEPAGCYIHGSVGSGKSTLMDLCCLFGLTGWRVRRQHFHEFSLWLHENLHALGGPHAQTGGGSGTSRRRHVLAQLADKVAEETDALFLDEFAITNVADAAIFSEFLRLLAISHVAVVCTTNRPPEDLYKDGLHRQRYVPALVQHFRGAFVVAAVNGLDYRSEMLRTEADSLRKGASDAASLAPERVFFEGGPPDAAVRGASGHTVLSPGVIKISWGRQLTVPGMTDGIACFHFNDLCRKALAAEDLLHVALRFHTVIVHSVPRLSLEEHNEARRFTNLVDALYEHSVRFFCHSEVPLAEVLRSVEALHNTSNDDGHDATKLGLFETMYDDQPNFQIQIKELGSREKWKELQDRQMVEEQRATAGRLQKLSAPAAAEGTTGSGWSAAPAGADLSAPDQGVAGVMVAAVGSLQESGFAARRAISRLKEMQTTPYLDAARRRRESMA